MQLEVPFHSGAGNAHRHASPNLVQYRPGGRYTFRLSYWEPRRELCLALADEEQPVRSVLRVRTRALDSAPALWFSIVLMAPAAMENATRTTAERYVTSVTFTDMMISGPQ